MPRASQTTQNMTRAGLSPTMTAPAVSPNGDVVDCGPENFLVVYNGSGAPINVTLDTTVLVDGLVVPDRVVAVAAGGVALIPLPSSNYAQASGADAGRCYVDYSAVASVTRAVVRNVAQ